MLQSDANNGSESSIIHLDQIYDRRDTSNVYPFSVIIFLFCFPQFSERVKHAKEADNLYFLALVTCEFHC